MGFGAPKRIEVKYDDATVKKMLDLIKAAPFPDKPPIDADAPWKLGIEHDYLKKLKEMFLTEWRWDSLEKRIAKFNNYLVHYEHDGHELDVHFIHVKSPRSDAIPLILLHGWPGTFFDFNKVIDSLVNPKSPDLPAFNVVVPSLPGYFLSTLPRRDGFGLVDIARLFDGLMTKVLGYSQYTGQGGDWGAVILRIMGSTYPDSVALTHFSMFPVRPGPDSDPSTYSELEKRLMQRGQEFSVSGMGYFTIQSTKPFTIGFAIASSPLAVLAYIGEKIYSWSDPGLVDAKDILDTVALYYLSGSFATSVMMYNQNSNVFSVISAPATEGKFLLKNKFAHSVFAYELGGASKADLAKYGPLAFHKEHSSGGHFPALDNPTEFIADLREFFGGNWKAA